MKKVSLKKRMYLMQIIALVVSTLTIATLLCCISFTNTRELSEKTSEQLVETAVMEINSIFNDMWDISRIIGRDTRIQSLLRTEYKSTQDMFSDTFEISAMLSEYNQFYPRMFCIYFFSDKGARCESKYYTVYMDNLLADPFYQRACVEKSMVWAPPQEGSAYSVTTGESLITAVMPVKELSSGRFCGAVVIEVEERRIQEFLGVGIGQSGFMYICDSEGQPVVFPEGVDREAAMAAIATGDSLVLKKELRYSGWSVVGVVPNSDLLQNPKTIIIIAVLTCIFVLLVAAYVSYKMLDRTLRPLDRLNETIARVAAGDMKARAQVSEYDEIGAVMLGFNRMVEQVDELMRREVENRNKLSLMELTMLHEQIKPHFLYNTLDSVVWMARAGNDEGIIRMTLALTNYLKTSLNKDGDIIPLGREIEHTASYLHIQSIRYKDQFVYSITVEPELEKCIVPKLIIQPLVENALYHGIKRQRELGRLDIRVAKNAAEQLCIDVADNGVGMTPQKAAELRSMLQNHSSTETTGFGVWNVNERIHIMYGAPYCVTFETEEGVGTIFHITIPKREEKENDKGNDCG